MTKLQVHSVNLDAVGSLFFANQLTYIQSKVYEYEYPALEAFNVLPISTDVPPGAEYVSYMAYQATGRARIIESYADDLPAADLQGFNMMQKIKSIGASYRYSHQEIRAAQLANLDLPFRQAEAARRAIMQTINTLAFVGNVPGGFTGFLNNPNVPIYTVPADGVGNVTFWSAKTPDQILRDLNSLINQIVVNSNGVERPNTVLLPTDQYTYIASTPRSATSDTTILNYFLLNNPYVEQVIPVPQLAGAGPTGLDIMIAYDMSANKLVMELPMPFTQYPPQERNLEFVINCEARFGGVSIFYPLSVNIGQGI
jgi:hypothetical protein